MLKYWKICLELVGLSCALSPSPEKAMAVKGERILGKCGV